MFWMFHVIATRNICLHIFIYIFMEKNIPKYILILKGILYDYQHFRRSSCKKLPRVESFMWVSRHRCFLTSLNKVLRLTMSQHIRKPTVRSLFLIPNRQGGYYISRCVLREEMSTLSYGNKSCGTSSGRR